MNTLVLPGDIRVAFSHLAAYGLAAIIKDSGAAEPGLVWSEDLDSKVRLENAVSWDKAGEIVQEHARRACQADSWVQADGLNGGGKRGLFSPRVKTMNDPELKSWYQDRNAVIDRLGSRLDREFIGALGEPAYWANGPGRPIPDYGASRWEMTNRQNGREFVGDRLRKLAESVASRSAAKVTEGLRGLLVIDEVGRNKPDSRTSTGLTSPQVTDNALAWCALWGISLLPVLHQTQAAKFAIPSRTAAHSGSSDAGQLCLPVVTTPSSIPRLKSILVSRELHSVVRSSSGGAHHFYSEELEAWAWLGRHGASGVAIFPVFRKPVSGPEYPEKWIQRGELVYRAHHG